MSRNQFSFAFAGLVLGFLVGFVVAHQVYAGRGASFAHPPIPAGMEGSAAPAASGGAPRGGMTGGGAGQQAGAASMEQVQKEIASLKSLLETEPKNVQALTRLGDMYFDAGMFDMARPFYERSLAEKEDVNVRTDLGTVFRNLGKPPEALAQFERAIADDPRHWKGWFNVGIVSLYDLRDFERAEAAFRKVEEINPGSIDMTELRNEIERVRSSPPPAGGAR